MSDDSDNEMLTNNGNGYERLHNDDDLIETTNAIIHWDPSQTLDEEDNSDFADIDDISDTNDVTNINQPSSSSVCQNYKNDKIHLNLSQNQITANKITTNNNGVKKQNSLESLTIITPIDKNDCKKNYPTPIINPLMTSSSSKTKLKLFNKKTLDNIIYDIPRRSSVPNIMTNITPATLSSKLNQTQQTLKMEEPVINTTTTSSLLKPNHQIILTPPQPGPSPISLQLQAGISPFSELEEKYKCQICKCFYVEPRVLDCLHSFCLNCLIDLDTTSSTRRHSTTTNQFLKEFADDTTSEWNFSTTSKSRQPESQSESTSFGEQRSSSINNEQRHLLRRKSLRRQSKERDSLIKSIRTRNMPIISCTDKPKTIVCPVCETSTETPILGIFHLPFNYVLARKTDVELLKIGPKSSITNNCNLCFNQVLATFHCTTCNINLCTFCKEAHSRQLLTSTHEIKSIYETRKSISATTSTTTNNFGRTDILKQRKHLKCPYHMNNDLKLFCTKCYQLVCNDCTMLKHRGHTCETIQKSLKTHLKLIKSSLEKTRPLSDYATHTIFRLNGITKKIQQKCDTVSKDVDIYLNEYFQALQVHQTTLKGQIQRAKEDKLDMIKVQQQNLEKRSTDSKTAIQFTEELLKDGSEIEILTFIGILLKRFDHCQRSKVSLDPKISESLQFLPDVKAPATISQNNIILYGIITTQIAVPKFCTLETKGLLNLRVHKKAELIVVTRDNTERPLCHGGQTIFVELRYKGSTRLINTNVNDTRDGTYKITFIPDKPGVYMNMAILIQGKHIKGSPFVLCARTLRPHSGIFHCCSFCSSGGIKSCACKSIMESVVNNYQGCGHGHKGHPGKRHWSCCGNVLENSECSTANVIINE